MAISTQNMIFVFGSNLSGIHGAGAARYARQYRGAQIGIGVGRTGQSYAIPTKGVTPRGLIGATLPLEVIKHYVDMFIAYTKANSHMFFQVTCIGCGLAGLRDEDVAPMFQDAPSNCYFDNKWMPYLEPKKDNPNIKYWGTF